MMACVPIGKREGRPAVRPDTLLVDLETDRPRSEAAGRVVAAHHALHGRALSLRRGLGPCRRSLVLEPSASRTDAKRNARLAQPVGKVRPWMPPPLRATASTGLKASMRALR